MREKLPKYKEWVTSKVRSKILTSLKPIHKHLEIDGFSIRISDPEPKNFKMIMEANTESRIKCVTRVKDKLWVTLYHDFSKLKYDTIRVINGYIRNLQNHFDVVTLEKLDLKIDSFGSFFVQGQ